MVFKRGSFICTFKFGLPKSSSVPIADCILEVSRAALRSEEGLYLMPCLYLKEVPNQSTSNYRCCKLSLSDLQIMTSAARLLRDKCSDRNTFAVEKCGTRNHESMVKSVHVDMGPGNAQHIVRPVIMRSATLPRPEMMLTF